ncbi:MAG: ABC-2 family transporter protein [Clostridiaceae bacterium]|nr:ABC-2 family transporter protein [Eubacteriales bacterium]
MKLYLTYLTIHLKSRMQYKASFFLTVLGQFLVSFSTFLGMYFLFERFHAVEGFTFSEVLLCFASILMSFSLAECFARGFDTFSRMIGNGVFDRILVRPRNEIFQVLATEVDFSRLGRLLQAVLVLAYAIPASGVFWSGEKVLTLLMMIVCGALVFAGLFVVYAALCFFTTEGLEFMNILTDGGREFGAYPFSVYGKGVLRFLTYAVPLALFQYYPFLYLVGRSENALYRFLPLVSLLFLLPCYLLWKLGLRHYKSTGS